MDVSGWTLAERMALPDWCFGMPKVYGFFIFNNADGISNFWIDNEDLPDPACIWSLQLISMPDALATGWLRLGMCDIVPANTAQMDACDEIFPKLGRAAAGPNDMIFYGGVFTEMKVMVRKGIVTGSKNLVGELRCTNDMMRFQVVMLVSELPDQINSRYNPKIA